MSSTTKPTNVPKKHQLVVALFGPTSSGKTALSVELALRMRNSGVAEPIIISADSRQVYNNMDIGTSKTTFEEMRGIPHELLNVSSPDRPLELEEYTHLARSRIEEHHQKGRIPLLVGGTGSYIASVLQGWDVSGTASLRASLMKDFPRSMRTDAYKTLQRIDRNAAKSVHPHNYDGIINALVRVMARQHDEKVSSFPRHVILGLNAPLRILYHRATENFDSQLRNGLFDEVCALAERYNLDVEVRRPSSQIRNQVLHTHGYREFFEYALEYNKRVTELSRKDVIEVRKRVLRHIHAYIRHQRAWFRKLPNLRMVDNSESAYRTVVGIIHQSS